MQDGMRAEVDKLIERAAELVELKAVCSRTTVDIRQGIVEIITADTSFESEKLASFLDGTDEVLIMGITGGSAVTDEIKNLQSHKKMTDAVVIDAAASEIVDAGFDWLAALYTKELVREGRVLTSRRFSAGYGDFDIRFQKDIHSMLDFESLGVQITESCMLMPEKSVTAIYGVNHG